MWKNPLIGRKTVTYLILNFDIINDPPKYENNFQNFVYLLPSVELKTDQNNY